MGQFSVEICHLVGQFSMKLNTVDHLSAIHRGVPHRRPNSGPRVNGTVQIAAAASKLTLKVQLDRGSRR